MCGIAGRINFDSSHRVDPGQLLAMARALSHRGPDDEGVYVDGNVGLSHRRLSIIDLSPQGRNPMCNEDGTIWIVFNGEIYNFRDLRPALEARGHRFRSRTDTEVVVHLYEEYGDSFVDRLRGMFALAIWDSRRQRVVLLRDRLGVKPLHYVLSSGHLMFASETKALLRTGEVQLTIDPNAINDFLIWQCIPSPRTAYQEIRKLPPASMLIWERTNNTIEVRQYWHLRLAPSTGSSDTIALQVREHVQEATALRMVADVPVGVFLSGGLDSACVLASMRKAHTGDISTFSISFADDRFDESAYARTLAEFFKTKHTEFRISHQAVESLPELTRIFDEPFGDIAALPTLYLSRLAREHVTVALSGDGGDENFGGYTRYLALKYLSRINRVPGTATLARLSQHFPYDSNERSTLRHIRETLALLGKDCRAQYSALLTGGFGREQWTELYAPDFRDTLAAGSKGLLAGWDTPGASDVLSRAMAADITSYIPECLNVKTDLATMASGLELRSPFLDYKLIEFAATIPSNLKLRGNRQKYILRKAFAHELPPPILSRAKAGFSLPIATWLRRELRDMVHDLLLKPNTVVADVVRREVIAQMLAEHIARKRNWHNQLWRLLVLESWFEARKSYAGARISQYSC